MIKNPSELKQETKEFLQQYLYDNNTIYLAKVTSPRPKIRTYYIPQDATLRTTCKNEIVIEFDTDTRAEGLYRCRRTLLNLDANGYNYFAYDHGSRSFHIHIYDILGLDKVSYSQRMMYKKLFLNKYAPTADPAMSKDKQLIALEYAKHFKHNNIKKLVGFNFDNDYNNIEESLMDIVNTKAVFVPHQEESVLWDNTWIIRWLTNERMPQGRRNNLILKNIAIVAYTMNLDPSDVIEKVVGIYNRKAGSSFRNWYRWAENKKELYVGISELMKYCEDIGVNFSDVRREYINRD